MLAAAPPVQSSSFPPPSSPRFYEPHPVDYYLTLLTTALYRVPLLDPNHSICRPQEQLLSLSKLTSPYSNQQQPPGSSADSQELLLNSSRVARFPKSYIHGDRGRGGRVTQVSPNQVALNKLYHELVHEGSSVMVAPLRSRQLWAHPNPTPDIPKGCRPIRLQSGGLLNIGNHTIITLAHDAVFRPTCNEYPGLNLSAPVYNISSINDKDPFYASTLPQIYAIAAATIVSYMLLIILFITPRTFFVGGTGGGNGFLGRRGMISGASGSTSVIGIGSRPWLQKVAALTVAVSLTIATVDTLRVAEEQYDANYQDMTALTNRVSNGLEIRVVRVISDTCLWLAQAQTLIRLFPRHKEKVIIKWTAFALILLDVIFSILNSFVYGNARTRPRTFVDTVPALNYLFAIALSILYMAWVLYYAISRRRFAFFHHKMRNICLMAMLSLTAILIPVVFFVLDIASPNVAGWGNYVRWVGAATASVVVWEWVERIEALERDENKDGILGREIFDGDEMLYDTPSAEVIWRNRPPDNHDGSNDVDDRASGSRPAGGRAESSRHDSALRWAGMSRIANHFGRPLQSPGHERVRRQTPHGFRLRNRTIRTFRYPEQGSESQSQNTTPAPTASSPVSRADTTSAASTVYRFHSHPVSESAPPIFEASEVPEVLSYDVRQAAAHDSPDNEKDIGLEVPSRKPRGLIQAWRRIPNLFKPQRASPPPEVSQAMATNGRITSTISSAAVQSRIGPSSNVLDRILQRRTQKGEETPLPVTVVPWQPRGRAYLDHVENEMPPSRSQPGQCRSVSPTLPTSQSLGQPSGPSASTGENARNSLTASSLGATGHLDPALRADETTSQNELDTQYLQDRRPPQPQPTSSAPAADATRPHSHTTCQPLEQETGYALEVPFHRQSQLLGSPTNRRDAAETSDR